MKTLIALPLLLLATPALAAEPIAGRWLTEDGKAVVEIGACGAAQCGRIARILAPTPNGPPVDSNNPNKALRKRAILGLPVLTGFKANGGKWRGQIYSPEEGRTYRSVLQRLPNGTLKVEGCVLVICQAQIWKRAR